jgi:carbon monoxide dehydrogenase subunit G
MALTVQIDLGYEFAVKASASDVFDVLSDVPTSASFFPSVDKLVDLGEQVYRWEMAKIGIAQIKFQTIYASKYASDKAKGTVIWTPVKGQGNALVSGHWEIKAQKHSSKVTLQINGELELPLPSLMKMVVAPLVEAEFETLVVEYVHNLIQRFGGEV